jgi:histone acetyltransferase 1
LTRAGKNVFPDSFHPTFTYAILGEEEIIPGYKDLKIDIKFREHDLKPSVKISYHSKMDPINDAMADLMDIKPKLAKYLGEGTHGCAGLKWTCALTMD